MKGHILIIRLSALGDVLMTVPIVDSLARQYPELEITMLSRPFLASVFSHMPANVHFMGVDLKGKHKGFVGIYRLFKELKAMNFTHIADFHDVLRSKQLRMYFHMTDAKIAHIDKERDKRKAFIEAKVKTQQKTSFEKYADVLTRLGFPIHPEFHSVFGNEKGDLSQIGLTKEADERWIGIAPFAAHEGKIYPLEKMEHVVRKLSDRHHIRIFLFGAGDNEKVILERWADTIPNVTSMAGKLKGLGQELILISHCDTMITMDSANMHLASLAATPVVSIWGATHPMAGFLGWNQKEENIVQVDLPCRPCSIYGNKPCQLGNYPCLNQIKADDIVAKVDACLQ